MKMRQLVTKRKQVPGTRQELDRKSGLVNCHPKQLTKNHATCLCQEFTLPVCEHLLSVTSDRCKYKSLTTGIFHRALDKRRAAL